MEPKTVARNSSGAVAHRKYRVKLVGVGDLVGNAPCRQACPVLTDAGLYASYIGRGLFSEAFEVAKRPNPLVQACARICGHPCEAKCRRGRIDSPVSIRALKRFAADFARKRSDRTALANPGKRHGTRVAVVGAGPAGLSAACSLAQLGHGVTVFEALPLPGGMLRYGIPEFRLPKVLLDDELQSIWDAGVELKTNCPLGHDYSVQSLLQGGYQAIFLAIGAQKGRTLGIDGEGLPGVVSAVDFLKEVARGQATQAGPKVVVVGGGFTALDAARTARRLGASEVRVAYRRTREQMPADQEEVRQAEEQGIRFEFLVAPLRILENGVGVLDLVCTRTQLEPSNESGRTTPVAVPGSEFTVAADTIIVAAGQSPDLSFLCEEHGKNAGQITVTAEGTLAVDRETLAANSRGVFAGGDAAFGPRLVINAIADGAKAAAAIDRYLVEGSNDGMIASHVTYVATPVAPSSRKLIGRQTVPALSLNERAGNAEVETGYDEKTARVEGTRCLQCFANTVFDASKCILCGACVDVCPESCLKMVSLAQVYGRDEQTLRAIEERYTLGRPSAIEPPSSVRSGVAIIKDEERCSRCGLCVQRCPTHAIHLVAVQAGIHTGKGGELACNLATTAG